MQRLMRLLTICKIGRTISLDYPSKTLRANSPYSSKNERFPAAFELAATRVGMKACGAVPFVTAKSNGATAAQNPESRTAPQGGR